MNRLRLSVFVCALFLTLVVAGSSFAQQRKPVVKTFAATDNEYTIKIKEYTTETYFRTELVDHLPMSDRVPSPDKVLGYIVGTPNKLTYTKDHYRYYRELAKASPRVRVFTAPERSEEGKEQILVAVGDEATLAKLDRYKEITAQLGRSAQDKRRGSTESDW